EELGRILRAMIRVVARSTVAEADVEKAVGPEDEIAAVVIGERLPDERQPRAPAKIEARRGIGDERIARRSPEPRDDGVARAIREVDEHAPARRVRREREAEQSLLAARHDRAAQIEEVAVEHDAVADGADAPGLFDDELDGAIGGILDERQRVGGAGP